MSNEIIFIDKASIIDKKRHLILDEKTEMFQSFVKGLQKTESCLRLNYPKGNKHFQTDK